MFGKGKEKELNKDMVENGMSENNTKNNEKSKKKLPKFVKIIIGVVLAPFIFLAVVFIGAAIEEMFEEEEPTPAPNNNTDTPIQITVENIQNNVTIINVGDISVEVSMATDDDEKDIEKAKDGELLATGKTKDGNSFKGRGDEVIVNTGKDKVKGKVKSSGKKTDTAKVAAAVSASLKSNEKPEKTDFSLKQSMYLADVSDCMVYYPTQMKLIEKNSKWLHFLDEKSESELFVRFTSLDDIAKSPVSLGVIEPSKYAARNDYQIVTSSATGNGYQVDTTLYYPDDYSYVYDVLKNLVKIQFMEQNIYSYQDTLYYGPSTEMQSIFFPSYDCTVIIPIEFGEDATNGETTYYRDYLKDHTLSLTFCELPAGVNMNNIFEIFDVVAEDDAVIMTENSVKWHNGSGIHFGAVNDYTAVFIEIDGADSWESYQDSLDYWDIVFTDSSLYVSDADRLRAEVAMELANIWAAINELTELEAQMITGSDPGDINFVDPNGSDPGDMSDPGDTLSNYEKMKKDKNSLFTKLPFSDLEKSHDVWDGDIARVGYYIENDGDMANFLDDLTRLKEQGYGVLATDEDSWGNTVQLLISDNGIGVWARYGNNAEIVIFRNENNTVTGREAGKIYFTYQLKQTFLYDILMDTEAMIDFTNDVNNMYNTFAFYCSEVDDQNYRRYFYEIDQRQDGGLQIDVYLDDERLSYVGTYAYVNYDLYEVHDGGQMTFLR